MLKRCILLLISYCLIMTGAACAAGVTITVAGQAKIGGPFVLLGDIAEVKSADSLRADRLRGLQLAAAPTPGTSQVWTPQHLGVKLAATGADFSEVSWNLPEKIILTSSAQTVRGSLLQQKALEALRSKVGKDDSDLEIALLDDVSDIIVPPGEVEIKIDFPATLNYNGFNSARAVVWVDGKPQSRTYVKLEMRLYRDVVVAERVIMAGQILKPDDIGLERMAVGGLSRYYTDPAKLQGLAAKRLINPGVILTERLLEKPLLIKRGNPVNLVAQVGAMRIVTAGQALQDGRSGQLIKVLNLSSNRVVSGRIIDAETVKVMTQGGSGDN